MGAGDQNRKDRIAEMTGGTSSVDCVPNRAARHAFTIPLRHYANLILQPSSRQPLHRNIHPSWALKARVTHADCRASAKAEDDVAPRACGFSDRSHRTRRRRYYYWLTRPAPQAAARAAPAVPVTIAAAASRDVPIYLDALGTVVGRQHGDDPQPDHRHAAVGELHRRPGGASGRHARAYRSAPAAGGA